MYPDCLLAKHEIGLLTEARRKLDAIGGDHQSMAANNLLPRCRPLVKATGQRIAFEAAKAAGVDQDLFDVYEASILHHDLAWYVENREITRDAHWEVEAAAMTRVFGRLDELFEKMLIDKVEPYITAPIVSDQKWAKFFNSIPSVSGNASYSWR